MKQSIKLLLIPFLFVVVFALSLVWTSVAYAETPSVVEVKMTEFYPAPNEEFSTTLYLDENSQVAALDFTLQYDSDYVTLLSVKEINATINHDSSTHRIHIAYANPQNATSRLELASLTFVVDNNISAGLYGNWLVWAGEGEDEAYTIKNSSYQSVSLGADLDPLFIRQKGDAYNNNNDGRVNSLDALHCLRQSVGSIQMSDIDIYYGNVYTDDDATNIARGRSLINSRDAIKILQYSVKMNVVLDSRVNVSFYDIDENGEYYLQIAKSVMIGESLTKIPAILSHDGYENGAWSLSSTERIAPDFTNIQAGFSVYAVYDHTGRTAAGFKTYYSVVDALDKGFFQAGKYIVNDFQLPYKSAYGSFNMLTSGEFSTVDIIWNPDSKQLAQGISIRDNYTVAVPDIDYTTWVTFSAHIYVDGIEYGVTDFDREIHGTIDLPNDEALTAIITSVSTNFAAEGEPYRLPGYVSLATGRMQYNVEMVQDVDIKWTLVEGNEKGFDGKKYGFIYLYEENPVKLKAQFSIDGKVFKTSYVELTIPAKTWEEQKEYATSYLKRYVPETLSGIYLFPTVIERFDFQVTWVSGSATGKIDTSLPIYEYKEEIYQQIGVGQNAGYLEQGYLDATVRRGDDSFALSFPLFLAGESDEVSYLNGRMPDENLYNALLPIFGVDDGEGGKKLTEQSLANCEGLNTKAQNYTLDLSKKGIENLKGIEYVTGVKRLVLSYNDLSGDNANLVRLASLTDLEQLDLSHCNLQDGNLSKNIFVRMYKLSGIDLSYNNLTDLSFLRVGRQLSSLNDLFVHNNDLINIDDLSFVNDKGVEVSTIPNVRRLTLSRRSDSSYQDALDISSLQYATNLSVLWLANHNINDLSALASCRLLTVLDLSHNDITATSKENDLLALRNLTSLGTLLLDDNNIVVVNELRKLRGLQHLSLSNNNIASLSTYINQMTGLVYLDLDNNELTSAELTSFGNLQYFYAENNKLEKIDLVERNANGSIVRGVLGIRELRLKGNILKRPAIENIAALVELQYLSLSGNTVGDLAFLSELTELTHLELANCSLNQTYQKEETDQYTNETYYVDEDNLTRLYGLNKLKILDISNNSSLTDISALADANGGLKALKLFYLDNVKISNADSIGEMKRITDLSMQNSDVEDLEFVKFLDAAQYINLSGHKANVVNGLWFSSKAELRYLFLDSAIDSSQTTNLLELGNLLDLQYLSLRNIAVNTIDNIPELESIVYLDLANTKIADFIGQVDENGIRNQDLRYDVNLKYLDVSGNDDVFTKSNLNALYDLWAGAPFCGELTVWLYADRDIVGFDAAREAETIHSYLTQFKELSSADRRKQIHTFYNGSDYAGYGDVSLQSVLREYDLVWSVEDANFAVTDNKLGVKDWRLFDNSDLTLCTAIDVYNNDGVGPTALTDPVYVAPSPYSIAKYRTESVLDSTETRYFNVPITPLVNGERDNFTFDGWFTQMRGEGDEISADYVNAVITAAGAVLDLTVFAKWLYVVTYDLNGGNEIEYTTKVYLEGSAIDYPAVSRDGYQIGGWYLGDTKLSSGYVSNEGHITVYVKWVGENVTIIRHDGLAQFGDTDVAEYGASFDLSSLSTDKTGYRFNGWYLDAALTTQISGVVTIDDFFAVKDGEEWYLYLYGSWSKNTYQVSVSVNDAAFGTAGGAGIYTYGQSVTVTATNSTGYIFSGWYVGSTKKSGNAVYSFVLSDQDVSLVAKFEPCTTHSPNSDCVCTKCGVTAHGTKDGGYCRHDEYIYFGTYPQTKVTNSSITSALDAAAGALPTASNTQKWTSYEYYISSSNTTDYMWYIDVTQGGETYRGVYFTSYRPYYTTNSSSTSLSYQDDNGYTTGNVYWFKYEPIKWRILSEEDGEAFLLAELILDSQEYYNSKSSRTINGNTVYANNYEYSNIRRWLNDTFYNTAFNDLQKQLILLTTVDNSARSTNPDINATQWNNGINSYACADTEDYVFLLSEQEVTTAAYGFNSSDSADPARQKKNTDYAKSQGVWRRTSNYAGNGSWWLRSPSDDYSSDAWFVGNDGNYYYDYVHYTYLGVVPALRIRFCPNGHTPDENCVCTKCGVTAHGTKDGGYCRHDEYIYFGFYPQSEVTDSLVTAALNTAAGTLPTASNSQNWTSYDYYIEGSNTTDYMWYIDVTRNGEKYRGVYFTSYRPYLTTDGSSASNSYQDENGYSTSIVYWFKYEPIKWRILSEEDGEAFLLAELILDSQEYYPSSSEESFSHNGGTGYANNYALSNIRRWLNDTFYNTAFSDLQKQLILLTTVDNSARSTNPNNNATQFNSGNNTHACADTEDYVFLLSMQEMTTEAYGFNSSYTASDSARQKKSTDYAKAQGVYTSTSSAGGYWWLRSPDYYLGDLARVLSLAGFRTSGNMPQTDYGVVPALKISLS